MTSGKLSKIKEIRDNFHVLGFPCEITARDEGENDATRKVYQCFLVDRLTQEKTLFAECDSPNVLAEYALVRGASEVAHKYDLVAYEYSARNRR